MKIGITGAYGFLGSNFTARLLQENFDSELVTFYSRTRSNPVFDSQAVTARQIDIRDFGDVREKTSDIELLCHFAGKVGYRKIDARSIWETNVHGTKNILDAAKINGIKKVLYVSSINVLGACPSNALGKEDNDVYDPSRGNPNLIQSPQMALDLIERSLRGDFTFLNKIKVPYFDSKLAAFELVKKYSREDGLPVITVFPGTVVGPGDIHKDISELIERVYGSKLLFTFRGGTSFVDVRDCALGIFRCLQRGTPGESYIVSGKYEDNLSYRDFMKVIAKAAARDGRKVIKHFFAVPYFPALVTGYIAESIFHSSSLTTALVHSGKMIHRFSSEKATREVGYLPETDLLQSIRDCFQFTGMM